MRIARGVCAALVIVLPAVAHAGADEILACRAIKNDAERLACFDKAIVTLERAATSLNVSPSSTENDLGGSQIRERERRAADPPPPTRMSDKLTRIVMESGKPVFFFENGQVWASQDVARVTFKGDGTDTALVERSLVGYLITVNASTVQYSVKRRR